MYIKKRSEMTADVNCHIDTAEITDLASGLHNLVVPSVLVAATPLRVFYPYCYSGYLVSCSLRDFTVSGVNNSFKLFPFFPIAVLIFALSMVVAVKQFGKKEMR